MDPFEPKQEVTTSNLTPEQFNLKSRTVDDPLPLGDDSAHDLPWQPGHFIHRLDRRQIVQHAGYQHRFKRFLDGTGDRPYSLPLPFVPGGCGAIP